MLNKIFPQKIASKKFRWQNHIKIGSLALSGTPTEAFSIPLFLSLFRSVQNLIRT